MALNGLKIEEMQQVSGAWVDPDNPAHQVFLGTPRLAALLPDIENAEQQLHEASPEDDPRAKQISAIAAETDALHDTLARGIFGYLTEVALLIANGERLVSLRDQLMPEGIAAVIRNTYRGQAGFAALLRSRLTSQTRTQLKAMPLPDGTSLADAIDKWLDAGDRLGQLEEEKARLESDTPSLAGRIHNARNYWIRVVNVVLAQIELEPLPEEAERLVFGPLKDAQSTAEARQARKKPEDTPDAEVVEAAAEG